MLSIPELKERMESEMEGLLGEIPIKVFLILRSLRLRSTPY